MAVRPVWIFGEGSESWRDAVNTGRRSVLKPGPVRVLGQTGVAKVPLSYMAPYKICISCPHIYVKIYGSIYDFNNPLLCVSYGVLEKPADR